MIVVYIKGTFIYNKEAQRADIIIISTFDSHSSIAHLPIIYLGKTMHISIL